MDRSHHINHERGVSPVIGVVLFVSVATMVMAVLGAAVFGANVFHQQPSAEPVYQEDGSGTVAIAISDATGLHADDTEVRLKGEGSCGSWDGSGDIEKGDVMYLNDGDCPSSLDVGDEIQIIGADTLIDTYELKGVATGGGGGGTG